MIGNDCVILKVKVEILDFKNGTIFQENCSLLENPLALPKLLVTFQIYNLTFQISSAPWNYINRCSDVYRISQFYYTLPPVFPWGVKRLSEKHYLYQIRSHEHIALVPLLIRR